MINGFNTLKIKASKEELITLVDVLEKASYWEGEYGNVRREMELEEQAELLKREILTR